MINGPPENTEILAFSGEKRGALGFQCEPGDTWEDWERRMKTLTASVMSHFGKEATS